MSLRTTVIRQLSNKVEQKLYTIMYKKENNIGVIEQKLDTVNTTLPLCNLKTIFKLYRSSALKMTYRLVPIKETLNSV